MRQQPFASPEEALEHYGTKGMKWGVRKEEDRAGRDGKSPMELASQNAQTKMYIAELKKIPQPTPDKAAAAFAANQEKFAKKFAPSEAPAKGPPGVIEKKEPRLSPGQKKALIYGGGAVAVIGGMYLANRYLNNKQLTNLGVKNLQEIDALAGKPIDPKRFYGLVGLSQGKTWMGGPGYLTESAFARSSFELPAGHTFFRLSTQSEGSFGAATYATHSLDDFNRYVAGFRQEKGLNAAFHQVTWKSTESVKVPNLTTVLSSMHSVLEEEAQKPGSFYKGMKVTPEKVMEEYQSVSGGGWSSNVAKGLIARLKEQGYSALVDEMDAGVIGETPLVFFSPENATSKVSKPLGSNAIKQAETLLKELSKPPGRKY